MQNNSAAYFRTYRNELGFLNQTLAKEFLAGRDIKANIDHKYISELNDRIGEIITRIQKTIHNSVQGLIKQHFGCAGSCNDKFLTKFIEEHVRKPHKQIERRICYQG